MTSFEPLSFETARKLDFGFLAVVVGLGLFSESPAVFVPYYLCALKAFAIVVVTTFSTQLLVQAAVKAFPGSQLIQTSPTAMKENVPQEIFDTVTGMCVPVACFIAWPWSRAVLGYETALRGDLADCVPGGLVPGDRVVLYILKAVVGMAFADAYNYWKHRFFHSRYLWPFHKVHHTHKNPSALGGYAISVAYGITTFFPIIFFAFPWAGLYAPIHAPFLGFYILLNHYLHCGYNIASVEKVLHKLCIMSSAWHNVHHEKGRVGFDYKQQTFAEISCLWDYWMGTYPQGHYADTVSRSVPATATVAADTKIKNL